MNSVLLLGQTGDGGQRRDSASPRWEMVSCVVYPEATKTKCPGNNLPRDSGTDTAVPARAQPELGVYLMALQAGLICERVPGEPDPIKRHPAFRLMVCALLPGPQWNH